MLAQILLVAVACLLIVAGIALIFPPAALIVAGLAVGLFVDPDTFRKGR